MGIKLPAAQNKVPENFEFVPPAWGQQVIQARTVDFGHDELKSTNYTRGFQKNYYIARNAEYVQALGLMPVIDELHQKDPVATDDRPCVGRIWDLPPASILVPQSNPPIPPYDSSYPYKKDSDLNNKKNA